MDLNKLSKDLRSNSALGSGKSSIIKSVKLISFNIDSKPTQKCSAKVVVITNDNKKLIGDLSEDLNKNKSAMSFQDG